MKYTCWPVPPTPTAVPGWALAIPIADALVMGYHAPVCRRVRGEIFAVVTFPTLAYCQAVAARAGYFAVELEADPMERAE
jgi:hypothetical protein